MERVEISAEAWPLGEIYEYAGFTYLVESKSGGGVKLIPAPGQHPAAYKEKHRRAALECYLEDHEDG